MSEQIEKDGVAKTKLELGVLGKVVGDQPFYIDYGYTSAEYAIKLCMDRLNNEEWRGSGYVFSTDEE